MTQPPGATNPSQDHQEHEDQPWTINIPGHPVRSDSPEYVKSRQTMNTMATGISNLIYGAAPYEDHHGGGLWLKDAAGWFLVRNMAGMEWSSQFCLDGSVRVLTADLRWLPISQLASGDELIAFDEESTPGLWRRWRMATVVATRTIERPCYDLTFDDGTEIRASAEHRWLVSRGGANGYHGASAWLETANLRIAGRFSSKVVRLTSTWGTDFSRDGGYLAAAYDGEGWLTQNESPQRGRGFGTDVRLGFGQRSNAMLGEVERILKERGFDYSLRCGNDNCNRVMIRGRAEVLRFLGSIRPARLLADFQPSCLGTAQRIGMATLVSKRLVGTRPVIALTTSTGTFVAEGLASHNCADPAKVDLLRQNAKRLYAAFPEAARELGIQQLLDTPITDAAGIAAWTDSICNASVPLPTPAHTGVLPAGGGVHHYPSPVTEIAFFKHDDFQLWVTDAQGNPAAVAPVSARGSGDGRVHVLYATPGSDLAAQVSQNASQNQPLILDPSHPLAQQAFAQQGGPQVPQQAPAPGG